MKKVLIFGAVKHAIEKAKELGYETIVVDQVSTLPTIKLADKFKCIPFEDFEANLEYAKQEKMLENGITNVPQFFEVENIEQLNDIKGKIKFPVIIKPASGLGSLHVYRIDDFETLSEKIIEVIDGSFNKKALIETFITGQEYGVESFVYNGKVFVLGIMKKNMTPLPYRSELGHIIPSELPEEIENKIKNVVTNLIMTLKINAGAVNMDLILSEDNEVFIIDVGARMGGNAITSHIIPLSKGIDHVGNVIKYSMGDNNIELEPKFNKCVVTRILDLDEGTIKKLPDFSKYYDNEVVEIYFEKAVGDKIEKYISDAQRCGFLVVQGEDIEKIKKKAVDIRNRINEEIVRS